MFLVQFSKWNPNILLWMQQGMNGISFQNEEMPEEWYVHQQAEKPTSSRHQEPYWTKAREECGLDSTPTSLACFVRIDHF